MKRYFLSKRAHVCVRRKQVLVLDLGSGKYMGLTPENSAALGQHIVGWPIESASTSEESSEALATLIARGLITDVEEQGKQAAPVKHTAPVERIADIHFDAVPRIRPAHVIAFCAATLRMVFAMRFSTVEKIVERIRIRKLVQLPRSKS